MEKNIQKKIIVCGPPHSGKSVLLSKLSTVLPSKYTYIVRGCPDGEGLWSNNPGEITQIVRKKDKFDEYFVSNVKKILSDIDFPIVLVDVGGIMSKENEEIFKECTDFVILSNDDIQAQKWLEFGNRAGLNNIAILKSRIDISEDLITADTDTLTGEVGNLHRGNKDATKVVKLLAQKIASSVLEQKDKFNHQYINDENVVDLNLIAEYFGIMDEQGNISWNPEDMNKICDFVNEITVNESDIKIYGCRPNWLACAIQSRLTKDNGNRDISFYDVTTDTYVKSQALNQGLLAKNNIIHTSVSQTDTDALVHIDLLKSRLSPEDMANIKLPFIDEDKSLYISGRLPIWLFTSLTATYGNSDKSIFQPGKGFFKFSSKNGQDIGTTRKDIEGIDIEKFFLQNNRRIENEKKGEIK